MEKVLLFIINIFSVADHVTVFARNRCDLPDNTTKEITLKKLTSVLQNHVDYINKAASNFFCYLWERWEPCETQHPLDPIFVNIWCLEEGRCFSRLLYAINKQVHANLQQR